MTQTTSEPTGKAREQRTRARRRVRQFGRIFLADGHSSIACVILDVSDCGARVLVSATAADSGAIPDHFGFFHEANHTFHDAEVVQRHGKTLGLRLVSTRGLGR